MTAKEKLYERAARNVVKLIEEGKSITAARTIVAAKFGLSYPTVVTITRHLSSIKSK